MNIEHSALLNDFISFWFETRVDGVLRYETLLNFTTREWHTCLPNECRPLLEGKWTANLADHQIIGHIAPLIDAAIKSGLLK